MRILDAALNADWAIQEDALENLLTIAAREHTVTDEALQAYRGKTLDRAERAKVRQGVAVLDVSGPLFKYANLMTELSGATSYDSLRRDLQAAADDGQVRAAILNIDSPGGVVNGASELAQAIRDFPKPIYAYVGGTGASAAYLLASSADRIIMNDMAQAGSLGVMSTYALTDPPKGEKTYTFISSQSPMKNASPDTKAGADAIQTRVDALAQVFLETVARNRGVAIETALKDFGKGGMFVGEAAVKAGLADEIGSFEAVLADLAGSPKQKARSPRNKGPSTAMSETATTATTATPETTATAATPAATIAAAPAATAPSVDVNARIAEALAADRARVSGLNRIARAHAVSDEELQAALDANMTVEAFALKVADDAAKRSKDRITALAGDEATVRDVKPSAVVAAEPTAAETSDTAQADKLAKEIAAFLPGKPDNK